MGLLAAAIAKRITRSPKWSWELALIGVLGVFLHIGADFQNNYGVHPFAPFSNRWHYGDTLYIVEPLIWFSLLPYVAREADRPWAKAGWWLTALCLLGLVWVFPTFTTPHSSSLTFFCLLSVFFVYGAGNARRRSLVAWTLFFGTLGLFFYGQKQAKTIARGAWQSMTEGTETWLDASSTPSPGKPFCWALWIASRESAGFRFRAAEVSLWPEGYPASKCAQFASSHTAILAPSKFPSSPSIHWVYESTLGDADLERFRKKSQSFRQLLSFARFPYLNLLPGGGAEAGDLRYDRERGIGFAEIEIAKDEPAVRPKLWPSTWDAPWEPPLLRN